MIVSLSASDLGPYRGHGLHRIPERWCTPFRGEWVRGRLDAVIFSVEESQVIVEEADQPDLVIDLAEADDLVGEHD